MGSVFWKGRQKKAEGSRGRGATGSSQSPLPHTDWRQRRPPEYLLLSFVFCSFFSSLRCWEVLYLFICSLSRSSVSSSISPFTWSTILAVHEPDTEGERVGQRAREKKEEGGFFGPLLFSFLPSSPPFHSSSPPYTSLSPPLCSPRFPPPPPLSAHRPLPNFFFSPPVFSFIYFRVILISLLVIPLYSSFNFVPFPFSFPPLFFSSHHPMHLHLSRAILNSYHR